jgi:hypothetical protein
MLNRVLDTVPRAKYAFSGGRWKPPSTTLKLIIKTDSLSGFGRFFFAAFSLNNVGIPVL